MLLGHYDILIECLDFVGPVFAQPIVHRAAEDVDSSRTLITIMMLIYILKNLACFLIVFTTVFMELPKAVAMIVHENYYIMPYSWPKILSNSNRLWLIVHLVVVAYLQSLLLNSVSSEDFRAIRSDKNRRRLLWTFGLFALMVLANCCNLGYFSTAWAMTINLVSLALLALLIRNNAYFGALLVLSAPSIITFFTTFKFLVGLAIFGFQHPSYPFH